MRKGVGGGVWPMAGALAVLLAMRVPALGVSEAALFAARAALTALLYAACRGEGWFWPAAQVILCAAAAWLLDLNEGAMAFVYGAAGLAMVWAFRRGRAMGAALCAALVALAPCALTALGMALVMTLGRAQMTPGAALGYALSSQTLASLAYLAGAFFAQWLDRPRPA